jgi:uncharacterized protein (DUF1697 family)
LGFIKLSTYIQSGNVIFQFKEHKPMVLATTIHKKIEADFGLDVPVLVLELERLKKIISENPFPKDASKTPSFLHVTFLAESPKTDAINLFEEKKAANEEIAVSNEAVYLYCPHGYGKTKLNNNFIENQLKVTATTRNWKTTLKLLELATELA